MSGEARVTVQLDDERLRVTRFDVLAYIEHWVAHRHDLDYLVVPIVDGELQVVAAGGISPQRTRAGESYSREAGTEHELVNGPRPYAFIEIEFKTPRST